MGFNWKKFDEMTSEYICHHQEFTAYVYRVIGFGNEWGWCVKQGEVAVEGVVGCANDAFLAAEEKMTAPTKPKKIIISHRGNISGPNTAKYGENHPNSILYALDLEYKCEVDVRWVDGEGYFLGHDKLEYKVDKIFLQDHRLYIHCKDVLTLYKLIPYPYTYIKIFFHQNDDIALITNSELLWTFPRADILLTPKSIAVMPELVENWNGLDKCAGVCSDFPDKYK